jgi:hypothetical protein
MTSRWTGTVAAGCALGVLVQRPALDGALFDDDYAQLAFLSGIEHPAIHARYRFDLYNFGPVSFFRPLTSASMNLDAALLGTNLSLFHAHSMLWYAVLLVIASALVRRAAPSIAMPFVWLFALGPAAASTVVWWCNRHLLVSAVFGCVALFAHVRWCEESWRPGRWLAPVSVVAALLAGESGMQALAFLAAYEAFGRAGARPSLRASLPRLGVVLAVAVAYAFIRSVLGYGVHGGVWGYFDPVTEPQLFARAAIGRLPELGHVLLAGASGVLPSAVARGGIAALAAVIVLYGVVVVVRPRYAGLPNDEARGLRWLLVGGALSLPISLASPQPVVCIMPALAVAALTSTLLRKAFQSFKDAAGVRRAAGLGAAAILVAVYAIASPIAVYTEVKRRSGEQRLAHRAMIEAPVLGAERDVIVTTGWWYLSQGKAAWALFRPPSHVGSWSQIELGNAPLRALRPTVDSLILERSEPWLERRPNEPFPIGPHARALLLDTKRLELDFIGAPADSFCILAFRGGSLVRLEIPEPGGVRHW